MWQIRRGKTSSYGDKTLMKKRTFMEKTPTMKKEPHEERVTYEEKVSAIRKSTTKLQLHTEGQMTRNHVKVLKDTDIDTSQALFITTI